MGSDIDLHKATYPSILGMEESKKILNNTVEKAKEIIKNKFGKAKGKNNYFKRKIWNSN